MGILGSLSTGMTGNDGSDQVAEDLIDCDCNTDPDCVCEADEETEEQDDDAEDLDKDDADIVHGEENDDTEEEDDEIDEDKPDDENSTTEEILPEQNSSTLDEDDDEVDLLELEDESTIIYRQQVEQYEQRIQVLEDLLATETDETTLSTLRQLVAKTRNELDNLEEMDGEEVLGEAFHVLKAQIEENDRQERQKAKDELWDNSSIIMFYFCTMLILHH